MTARKRNDTGRLSRRWAVGVGRFALGCALLLSPILLPVYLLAFAPVEFEKFYNAYTGLRDCYLAAKAAKGEPIAPFFSEMAFRGGLFVSRIGIEFVVRSYPHLAAALRLSLALLVSAFGIAFLADARDRDPAQARFRPLRGFLLGASAFFVVAWGGSRLLGTPSPWLLGAILALLYAVNFPLASYLAARMGPARLMAASSLACVAFPAIFHLVAPGLVVSCALRWFFPGSERAFRAGIAAGRAALCLVVFPLAALGFSGGEEPPLSDRARVLLAGAEAYDIEMDRPGGRMLVTRKVEGEIYVVPWDLHPPYVPVKIESEECEDIALDAERRILYHAVRNKGLVQAYDADSFALKAQGDLSGLLDSGGSTNLALDARRRRLFVSEENGLLYAVDADSLRFVDLLAEERIPILGLDEANGRLYAHFRERNRMTAYDVSTCRPIAEAAAPGLGERMVLSQKRGELYSPDTLGGTVWVYSASDLTLLRKIRCSRGVRAIALDDDRGLLLAANFVTGYVDAIDLETEQRIGRVYVGPYCRILKLDAERRLGFVTLRKKGLVAFAY